MENKRILGEQSRSLLKKIIDVIKDFINSIKGLPQFKTHEQDLRYLEERLTWVYQYADNKKTANDSGEVYKKAEKIMKFIQLIRAKNMYI